MGESVFEDIDDILPDEPEGELVHWMEPRPPSLGPTGVSLATAGAFALGALATVGVLALLHWGPQRRGMPLRGRRRR